MVTTTQTLSSQTTIKITTTATIQQSAFLNSKQTLLENAHIKGITERQTVQDAWIIVTGQIQTLSQNATIKKPDKEFRRNIHQQITIKTTSSFDVFQNMYVKAVQIQTLNQNAYIKTTVEQDLLQNVIIKNVEVKTLNSNAYLNTNTIKNLSQNIRIKLTSTVTLPQNAYIKTTGIQLSDGTAILKLTSAVLLQQNARILGTSQKTLLQNANVFAVEIKEITEWHHGILFEPLAVYVWIVNNNPLPVPGETILRGFRGRFDTRTPWNVEWIMFEEKFR